MNRTEQLEVLFTDYVAQVTELVRKRKLTEGILGMGGGPQDHPCHEAFDKQVEAQVQLLLGAELSPAEAAQVAGYLLNDEDVPCTAQCARLMLIAVQRHTMPLIPLLDPEDARQLLTRYTARYPRLKQFPAQKQVIEALKRQAR